MSRFRGLYIAGGATLVVAVASTLATAGTQPTMHRCSPKNLAFRTDSQTAGSNQISFYVTVRNRSRTRCSVESETRVRLPALLPFPLLVAPARPGVLGPRDLPERWVLHPKGRGSVWAISSVLCDSPREKIMRLIGVELRNGAGTRLRLPGCPHGGPATVLTLGPLRPN